MENTFSYEQIVAIIRLLAKLCDIDDKSTAEEQAVIMQVLHAAFEDSVSIVEAVNDAEKCDIETALGRISQLEPGKKQTVSELAFAVLVADGVLTDEEVQSIFALHNQYGFPDKELLQDLMDWLDALANHVLLADGDGAEAVSAKNMELALEAIDALE